MLNPFHLAIPVNDLQTTRQFYGEFLGFEEGRATNGWIDWNFFGHQLVTHLKPSNSSNEPVFMENVDNQTVPVPHFGVVLGWRQWHAFAERLKDNNVTFVREPYIRFQGAIGEQATLSFLDPSGNALEFKAFPDATQMFAKYE